MFTSLKKSFMKAKQAVKDVGKVIIIAIGVGLMLGGCGTTVKTEVVKESSYYHPSVPEKFFVRVVLQLAVDILANIRKMMQCKLFPLKYPTVFKRRQTTGQLDPVGIIQ